MKLDRALCSPDIETTGLDPMTARIVEMGLWFLYPDGTRKGGSRRFNPGCPIPPESTAIHGITDADVKDCPPFSTFAPKVLSSLQGKDIVGYNLRSLDLPVLDAELRRCGLRLDLSADQRIVDCFRIFQQKAPRDLAAAVRTYCGREHDGGHNAGADAAATIDVLLGQIAAHEDLAAMDLAQLAEFSQGDFLYCDWGGKLYRDKEGDMCFSFGKNKDRKIRMEKGYCDWMITKGQFPASTLETLTEELHRLGL